LLCYIFGSYLDWKHLRRWDFLVSILFLSYWIVGQKTWNTSAKRMYPGAPDTYQYYEVVWGCFHLLNFFYFRVRGFECLLWNLLLCVTLVSSVIHVNSKFTSANRDVNHESKCQANNTAWFWRYDITMLNISNPWWWQICC